MTIQPGTQFCIEKIGLKKNLPSTVFERNKSRATYLAERENQISMASIGSIASKMDVGGTQGGHIHMLSGVSGAASVQRLDNSAYIGSELDNKSSYRRRNHSVQIAPFASRDIIKINSHKSLALLMEPTNKMFQYKSNLFVPDPAAASLVAPSPLKSSLKASSFGF